MNNSVTCTGVPINSADPGENLCTFAVKTVVCESNESSLNSVTVILKGSAHVLIIVKLKL